MKKISLVFSLLCIMFWSENAKAGVVSLEGKTDVCVGSKITYWAYTRNLQPKKIVWMCGGAGHFSDGSNTLVSNGPFYGSPLGSVKPIEKFCTQEVTWSGGVGQSWVTARYYFPGPFGTTWTDDATFYVNIGIQNNPTAITAPDYVCSTMSRSYPISCTAVSPATSSVNDNMTVTNSYIWTVTSGNATIQNATTTSPTNYLSVTAGTTPIVVSVRYQSGCDNSLSSIFSKTIYRVTGAPTGEIMSYTDMPCSSFSIDFTAPLYATVQTSSSSTGPWGSGTSYTVIYPRTRTIYARTINDCGASAVNSYFMGASSDCGGSGGRAMNNKIVEKTEMNLFPNPSNGQMQLNYTLEKTQQGELQITDMLGKKVSSYKLTEGENTLSINESELKDGIYLYRIVINNELVKTDKFSIGH